MAYFTSKGSGSESRSKTRRFITAALREISPTGSRKFTKSVYRMFPVPSGSSAHISIRTSVLVTSSSKFAMKFRTNSSERYPTPTMSSFLKAMYGSKLFYSHRICLRISTSLSHSARAISQLPMSLSVAVDSILN
jgi:hypothetical protein